MYLKRQNVNMCVSGECIAGIIINKKVSVKNWDAEIESFNKMIFQWNEKTKTKEIPHPGFARKNNFCMNCGLPVSV